MNFKQRVVRILVNGLQPEERELMVNDFLYWLLSDCRPTEYEKRHTFWIPKLNEYISAGLCSPWLLIYHYLNYLVSLRWLRRWFSTVKTPQEDQIIR